MQFKINLSDIKLLIEEVEDAALVKRLIEYEKDGQYFEKGKYPSGQYLIDLSEDEVEVVINSLSDYLMIYGVSNDGEPNALGLQVETLIDVFNDGQS